MNKKIDFILLIFMFLFLLINSCTSLQTETKLKTYTDKTTKNINCILKFIINLQEKIE